MLSRTLALGLMSVSAAAPIAARGAEPASVPAPTFRVGDSWIYDATIERGTMGFTEGAYEVRIEDVRDDGMIMGVKRQNAPRNYQDQERGLDWSERRLVDGTPTVGERPYDFPLSVGKTWTVDYDDMTRYGLQTSTHVHKTFKVTGWEDVTTPAGAFHALRIEGHGTLKAQIAASNGTIGGGTQTPGSATAIVHTQATPAHVEYGTQYVRVDYVPEIKSFVKSVQETYNASGVRTHRETRTLESFKPAS